MLYIFFILCSVRSIKPFPNRDQSPCHCHNLLPLFLSSSLLQLWIEERMPLAMSEEHGHNLQTVQMLHKKNQVRDLPVFKKSYVTVNLLFGKD